jgi:hypothetical protein
MEKNPSRFSILAPYGDLASDKKPDSQKRDSPAPVFRIGALEGSCSSNHCEARSVKWSRQALKISRQRSRDPSSHLRVMASCALSYYRLGLVLGSPPRVGRLLKRAPTLSYDQCGLRSHFNYFRSPRTTARMIALPISLKFPIAALAAALPDFGHGGIRGWIRSRSYFLVTGT